MSERLNRAKELIQAPSESLAVEIKNWLDPGQPSGQAQIVRAALALRNFDGGHLIIGFNDDTRKPEPNAPANIEQLFHIDRIQGLIAQHSSEPFEIFIDFPEKDGQQFPVLTIPSGVKTPVAIKADLKDNNNNHILKQNEIYVRTLNSNNIPSSSKAGWKDWAQLMEVCFDNREADIGRFLRRHLIGVDSKSILETLNNLSPKPAPTRDQLVREFRSECVARFETVRTERSLKLPKHGAWEVALLIPNMPEDHMADQNFLQIIKSSNPQYSGWPCWLVSDRFPDINSHPYPYNGRWEQFIVSNYLNTDIDFMTFDPRGRFYQRRALREDLRSDAHSMTQLEWAYSIKCVTEAIAVGLSLAKALGNTNNEEPLTFLFRWDKLNGRHLVSWENFRYHFTPRGPARQDIVEIIVNVPQETPIHSIVGFVETVIRQLFLIFDGYSTSRANIERFAREVFERNRG